MEYLQCAASEEMLRVSENLASPNLDGQKPVGSFKGDHNFVQHEQLRVDLEFGCDLF
jgi:hypothetical protein